MSYKRKYEYKVFHCVYDDYKILEEILNEKTQEGWRIINLLFFKETEDLTAYTVIAEREVQDNK